MVDGNYLFFFFLREQEMNLKAILWLAMFAQDATERLLSVHKAQCRMLILVLQNCLLLQCALLQWRDQNRKFGQMALWGQPRIYYYQFFDEDHGIIVVSHGKISIQYLLNQTCDPGAGCCCGPSHRSPL